MLDKDQTKTFAAWYKRDFFAWVSVFFTLVAGGSWALGSIIEMKTAQATQMKDTYYQGKKIDDLMRARAEDKVEYMDKIKEVQQEQKVILGEIRKIGNGRN